MSERRKVAKQSRSSGTLPSGDLQGGTLREVEVTYVAQPSPVPQEQEIHPRRSIPTLPIERTPPTPKRRKG